MLAVLSVAIAIAAPVQKTPITLAISEDQMESNVSFFISARDYDSIAPKQFEMDPTEIVSCVKTWLHNPSISIKFSGVATVVDSSVLMEPYASSGPQPMYELQLGLKGAYALSELNDAIMKPWPRCNGVVLKKTSSTTTTSTGVEEMSFHV